MQKKIKKYQFETLTPVFWNKVRLLSLLKKFQKKKILVIGDVGVDRYTTGVVERISPEAPVPIVLVQDEKLKLGLAANVADNISVLQGVPLLVGVVGKDRGAEDLKRLLKKGKMSPLHLIADASRRTVLKERIVSDRQQLVRVDYESTHFISPQVESQVLNRYKKLLPQVDGVVVEDYAKGGMTATLIHSIVKLAHQQKKWIAVDPNLKTPVESYSGVSLLTPNTKEAEFLSGIKIEDYESLLAAGVSILNDTQAQHVVITRGKDGMAIFEKGQSKVKLIPTFAQEVYDVSGAGDTVVSVLALAQAAGAAIDEACILGNLAAGVEVGKRGTATVSPEEIETALSLFTEE